MIDVAILTYEKLLNPDPHSFYVSQALYEESLMLDYFKRNGIKAERIDWADRSVDWSRIGCAVFRSTWDYQDRLDQFEAWLEHVKNKTRLVNSYDVIKWNLDKRYLSELDAAGIKTVPTLFIERQTQSSMDRLFAHFEADELVIKPAVSAGGIDTYRVSKSEANEFEYKFQELLSAKTMMAQPFQHSILDQGELSLIVINGQFTHAARKVVKAGEFRVQDDYGGYTLPHAANDEEKNFAEKVVKACPKQLYYARVDVVYNDRNALSVMEVELFEPDLFFRFDRSAAEKFAKAILS
ncbi:MAG: ATP-grasp domain-containing protein [Alphaproteobacteria bacterium]|nr:ATP-grasp domain-containing protein [Alphaproteobacteria bacterium]